MTNTDTHSNFTSEQIKIVEESVEAYDQKRLLCEEFVNTLVRIIGGILSDSGLKTHSIIGRVKTSESFKEKALKQSDHNPNKPKYDNPLEDINDQSGIRIIVFLRDDVNKINDIIKKEFCVHENIVHGESSSQKNKFGYKSTHFIVTMSNQHLSSLKSANFENFKVEIQVRTILQHAWAEIEHGIAYKSKISMFTKTERDFAALAGLLEIADNEFQRIKDENKSKLSISYNSIEKGLLDDVEITRYTLKYFLDKHLGSDERVSDFNYGWYVDLLKKLGFRNFKQINECVSGFDGGELSIIAYGTRQGQIAKFRYMLLAGMGDDFITEYSLEDKKITDDYNELLEKFKTKGIKIRSYTPNKDIN